MDAETFTAFVGDRRVAAGTLPELLAATKPLVDADPSALLLTFSDRTGRQVDFDFRGSLEEVLERHVPPAPTRRRGRPRLGVVSREVTLLPRQWEWLEAQPKGISAALRRLVDEAQRRDPELGAARRTREAMCHFITALAGDRPGYEEATRALFAGDRTAFDERIGRWPADVAAYLRERSAEAFPPDP